jgi:hypothetical protein
VSKIEEKKLTLFSKFGFENCPTVLKDGTFSVGKI